MKKTIRHIVSEEIRILEAAGGERKLTLVNVFIKLMRTIQSANEQLLFQILTDLSATGDFWIGEIPLAELLCKEKFPNMVFIKHVWERYRPVYVDLRTPARLKQFLDVFKKLSNEELEKILLKYSQLQVRNASTEKYFIISKRDLKYIRSEYLQHLGYKPGTEIFNTMMETAFDNE